MRLSNNELYDIIIKILKKNDISVNIIFCSLYGSFLYNTNTPESDYDILIITDTNDKTTEQNLHDITFENNKFDITIRSQTNFTELFKSCDIIALETIFAPKESIIIDNPLMDNYRNSFILDIETKKQIRKSLSTKSDWAEVRARKKLADKEYKIAIRSLYHSYRIIKFGIQIAKYNQIINWSEANDLWETLKDLKQEDISPQTLKDLYKKYLQNGILTEFKQLLPK